jgi:hypothetical protein
MELMRKVMGEGGEVSFLSDHPALAKVAAVRSIQRAQVRAGSARGVKGCREDDLGCGGGLAED